MNLSDDYFLDIDDEMLEYLETRNEKMIDEIIQANNKNTQIAQFLFNLLTTGATGCFLLSFNNERLSSLPTIILLIISLCWALVSIYLLIYAIKPNDRPAKNNRSANLYHKMYKEDFPNYCDYFKRFNLTDKLAILRRYELISQEKLISELLNLNIKKHKVIQNALCATITPILLLSFILLLIFLLGLI